jgi:hypothetical protein
LVQYHGELDWMTLTSALRLWMIWQHDAPLSVGRHDVVRWLLLEVPEPQQRNEKSLPLSYVTICATFRLWNLKPVALSIPISCTSADPITPAPHRAFPQLARLGQRMPEGDWGVHLSSIRPDVNIAPNLTSV